MRSPYNVPIQRPEGETDNFLSVDAKTYERCNYCHAKLEFDHQFDTQSLLVVETSRCPVCGVTSNPKRFTVQ